MDHEKHKGREPRGAVSNGGGARERRLADPFDPLGEPLPGEDLAWFASRVRIGAAVVFLCNALFVILDAWIAPRSLAAMYVLKVPSLAAAGWLWWYAPRAGSVTTLSQAALFANLVNMLMTGPSTVLVGVPWHALVLAGIVALGSAALFPWGARMQAWLVVGILPPSLLPFLVLGTWGSSFFVIGASIFALGSSVAFAWQNQVQREAIQRRIDAFREYLERLRLLTEHIRGVFWLREWDGEVLYVSSRYDEVWQRDRVALRERPDDWLEAIHPGDRARVESWARRPDTSGPDSCEYRLLLPDRSVRWIRDTVFPIDQQSGLWRFARFSMDVTAEKESERARLVQGIARRTHAAVEEERKRMARDLHDDLGQALTGIRLLVSAVVPTSASDRPRRELCLRTIDGAMASLRAMIGALRPPVLDELGPIAALRSQADDIVRKAGVRCEMDLPDDDAALSEEEATTVFRITQEAFTNAARHAGAHAISLALSLNDDRLDLRIEDDGVGIGVRPPGFGMRGMRERAALLNGSLEIEPRPGGGTRVHLQLPRVPASAAAGEGVSEVCKPA